MHEKTNKYLLLALSLFLSSLLLGLTSFCCAPFSLLPFLFETHALVKGLIVVYVLFLVLFISRGLFLGLKCLVARRRCPRERGRERMEKAREWRREIVCVVKAELQTRSRTESALTHARTNTDTNCACCLFFFIIFITPYCEMLMCQLAWLSLKVCDSHQI